LWPARAAAGLIVGGRRYDERAALATDSTTTVRTHRRRTAMSKDVRPDRSLERLVGKAAEPLATSLGITTPAELLYHFPRKVLNLAHYSSLRDVRPGHYGTVMAEVVQVTSRPTRRQGLYLTTLVLTDAQGGRAEAVFFGRGRRMEYALKKTLSPGSRVELSGDVQWHRGSIQFRN